MTARADSFPLETQVEFVLGDIPAPSEVRSFEQFELVVSELFYNLILLHSEYLYAGSGKTLLARRLESNLRALPAQSRENLEALFLDQGFQQILSLLQRRGTSGDHRAAFFNGIQAQYRPSASEESFLAERVGLIHGQLQGTLIGEPGSILNLLIKLRREEGYRSRKKLRALQQAKSKACNIATADQLIANIGNNDDVSEPTNETRFYNRTIASFIHRSLSDPTLLTLDILLYLLDQYDEQERVLGKDFSFLRFLFDTLFIESTQTFLRHIQAENPQDWLAWFFETFFKTLNELCDIHAGEPVPGGLDHSFHHDEARLDEVKSALQHNQLAKLVQLRDDLACLIATNNYRIDTEAPGTEALCGDALAAIFLPSFQGIQDLRTRIASLPRTERARASKEARLQEAEIRTKFMETAPKPSRKAITAPRTPPRIKHIGDVAASPSALLYIHILDTAGGLRPEGEGEGEDEAATQEQMGPRGQFSFFKLCPCLQRLRTSPQRTTSPAIFNSGSDSLKRAAEDALKSAFPIKSRF